ncbi:MAG: hypothetical protein IKO76_01330 [Butyrivibrio sp.]|nr:hypothetical protein [Butyrivibrio sp.]
MIRRSQYRCSFKIVGSHIPIDSSLERCKECFAKLIDEGLVANASFYRYENMGFLYVEEIVADTTAEALDVDKIMADLNPYLKPWPEEDGDAYFAPMINVYYHHIPEDDIDLWEHERTTAEKTRVGRVAFVFPDKLPSYVRYHNAIVEEGLLKGDKYAFISLHENLLFSYYEEPRNNVNIKGLDEESKVINDWMAADPESHFDRVKAEGSNFLVIPCLFSVDRVDCRK